MRRLSTVLLLVGLASACTPMRDAHAAPPPQQLAEVLETVEGLASYYARMFHGRVTASGIPFDINAMVAAHPTWPFGTTVRVTHLENRQSVEVTIVDRGPALGPRKEGVIIDLSRAAARKLALLEDGRARVQVDVLRWGAEAVAAKATR
jgi:rare lipoprotein A